MISGVSTGGSGLLQVFARADRIAERTARPAPDSDPAQNAVSLVEARVDAAASTAVLRASDELHRRLLDLRV